MSTVEVLLVIDRTLRNLSDRAFFLLVYLISTALVLLVRRLLILYCHKAFMYIPLTARFCRAFSPSFTLPPIISHVIMSNALPDLPGIVRRPQYGVDLDYTTILRVVDKMPRNPQGRCDPNIHFTTSSSNSRATHIARNRSRVLRNLPSQPEQLNLQLISQTMRCLIIFDSH